MQDINILPRKASKRAENIEQLFIIKLVTFNKKVFNTYLFSYQATWFWIIIILSVIITIFVLTVQNNNAPLIYFRYLLGTIYYLILPGYGFIKVLYPGKGIDTPERVALSIMISLVLIPIVGLLLNYTLWGITQTSVILSLLVFTVVMSSIGIVREFKISL